MTRDETAAVIVAHVIAREGGIGQVKGETWTTRFGQTPDWLAQYGLPVPTTTDEATANYRRWLDLTGLIAVCDLPDSFCDVVIDWAVNSGVKPVVLALQRRLGVNTDGVLGPVTATAIARVNRERMARLLLGDRLRYDGRLITDRPAQYAQFASGWANRIAAQIEALS